MRAENSQWKKGLWKVPEEWVKSSNQTPTSEIENSFIITTSDSLVTAKVQSRDGGVADGSPHEVPNARGNTSGVQFVRIFPQCVPKASLRMSRKKERLEGSADSRKSGHPKSIASGLEYVEAVRVTRMRTKWKRHLVQLEPRGSCQNA